MKIISFTGGLGAQIISAAAYHNLLSNHTEPIGAYFGYFQTPFHLATPGIKNDMSHWKWELGCYGIEMWDFLQPSGEYVDVVWDGPEKLNLGMDGLIQPNIANKFAIGNDVFDYKKQMFGDKSFACMHIRRGDYVNVASFIVSDYSFIRMIAKICKFVDNLLVVSDSPLSNVMIEQLNKLDVNSIAAIGGNPHMVHGLMRLSDILICSNSQFSLTAAALRDDMSLTLYPAQHDSDLESSTNKFLSKIREFQVITKF